MKLKSTKARNSSPLIFENLVDKRFGKKRLSFENSARYSGSGRNEEDASEARISENFLSDLPEFMRIELAASVLGLSTKTIYDWRYRCVQRKMPIGLFVKVNRLLLVRTSVLKEWIASQNPSLQSERNQRICVNKENHTKKRSVKMGSPTLDGRSGLKTNR